MKRLTTLFCICMMALNASPAIDTNDEEANPADSSFLLKSYLEALDSLVWERDSLFTTPTPSTPNPYYYLILSQPTLYSSSLHQAMGHTNTSSPDLQIQRLYASRKMLSMLYASAPGLVTQTESDILGQAGIRSDIHDMLGTSDKLADKVAAATLNPVMDEPVEVITRRPNFWKFAGSTALQFMQSYFTDNWYQGGEKNYMGNLDVTLRANYDDQRKIIWENTLDIQLGFQTTESDKNRTFRPNHNLLRYTFNGGYKAWKSWYYSLLVILKTQIAPTYQKNTDNITSEFLAPLEVTVAPGMKYEIKWGKKKKFTGQLNVAPLAMNVLYVGNDDLVKNYGIEEGKNQRTTFGPNITLNTNWPITKQINWRSRMYWMSNFDYNIWEWENTIDFTVSKLITTTLYLYPRFDNSNEKYKERSRFNTYMMFKEWLSLGLKYSF
ncbi:MAG: DUF3078 domain-containing protein [Bacteroidaceae bacterium]|nr:DUF3078 domain-containing protein [Bacteroidaceae bacterium]